MRPAVDLRHRQHQVTLRHVADREDVEEAVVRLGAGADLHPAAEEPPVRDDRVEHPTRPALAVDVERELGRLPAREDGERRPQVGELAAERLRRLVGALAMRRSCPRCRRSRTRPRRRSRPRAVRHATEVDRAGRPLERHAHRPLDVARDPERPHEVPAGAARHDGELRRIGEADEPFAHLVHRSVAADDDEQARAGVRRLAGELCEVARPRAEGRVALEPGRGGTSGDLGQRRPWSRSRRRG